MQMRIGEPTMNGRMEHRGLHNNNNNSTKTTTRDLRTSKCLYSDDKATGLLHNSPPRTSKCLYSSVCRSKTTDNNNSLHHNSSLYNSSLYNNNNSLHHSTKTTGLRHSSLHSTQTTGHHRNIMRDSEPPSNNLSRLQYLLLVLRLVQMVRLLQGTVLKHHHLDLQSHPLAVVTDLHSWVTILSTKKRIMGPKIKGTSSKNNNNNGSMIMVERRVLKT